MNYLKNLGNHFSIPFSCYAFPNAAQSSRLLDLSIPHFSSCEHENRFSVLVTNYEQTTEDDLAKALVATLTRGRTMSFSCNCAFRRIRNQLCSRFPKIDSPECSQCVPYLRAESRWRRTDHIDSVSSEGNHQSVGFRPFVHLFWSSRQEGRHVEVGRFVHHV